MTSFKAKNPPFPAILGGHEKLQLIKRLPAPLIRHLLASYRADQISRRRRRRRTGHLPALASTNSTATICAPVPRAKRHLVARPLRRRSSSRLARTQSRPCSTKLLSSKPPSSYSAAASELLRRCDFQTDRASVRRWAIQNQLAPDTRYKTPPQPVKRWQVRDCGALWQYDASPHAWLPSSPTNRPCSNLLDDATRYNTGARLYPSETLLAHFDFLSRAFQAHGLPLALYVDYHSFFYTHNPDAFTQLGAALHFYGVALRYAPTPQAKGKIERRHDYWQKRLPPLLAADQILELVRRQPPAGPTAAPRQPARNPPRTGHHPARRPPIGPGRKTLRSAPRPRLSLVALCLEPANPGPRRRRWQSPRGTTSVIPLPPRPAPPSSAACDPTETSSTSTTPQTQRPNPSLLLHCPVF